MKIPTTLGLALLTILLTVSILLYIYYQQIYSAPKFGPSIQSLQIVNLTDSSVSFIWQTKSLVTGSVSWGENGTLTNTQDDDRDNASSEPRVTHFVSLSNLLPNKTYNFKIESNQLDSSEVEHFITTKPENSNSSKLARVSNTSITGSVLDSKLQPVKEALVILIIPNASPIATFTSTAGNFLLPTVNLRTLNGDIDPLNNPTQAQLTILAGDMRSIVTLTVPTSKTLPPIILGQNSNLTN